VKLEKTLSRFKSLKNLVDDAKAPDFKAKHSKKEVAGSTLIKERLSYQKGRISTGFSMKNSLKDVFKKKYSY
jgi:hypothetical protein